MPWVKKINGAVVGEYALDQGNTEWVEDSDPALGTFRAGLVVNNGGSAYEITLEMRLAAYASEKRRALANGSAVIDVGERAIPTWVDPESRGAITGLVVAAGIVPSLTAPWKGADGTFYVLTTAEITALALGMMQFVQDCFTAETAVLAAIDAETITTMAEIDAAAWPSAT